jgi:hypothetical protein
MNSSGNLYYFQWVLTYFSDDRLSAAWLSHLQWRPELIEITRFRYERSEMGMFVEFSNVRWTTLLDAAEKFDLVKVN